jgi:SnoaL-like protein
MTHDIRQLTVEYNRAFGEGRIEDLRRMLHPDLEFDGTVAKPTRGRDEYLAGLPRLCSILERNELRELIVDGDRAFVLYDFVTDTPAGAVLSGELLTYEDGLIRKITLLFDWRRWPEAVAEVQKRAVPAAAG